MKTKLRYYFTLAYALLLVLLRSNIQAQGNITHGDPGNFITTWQTDNEGTSNDNQITIPTYSGASYSYNYNIYWEEVDNAGNSGTETGVTGSITLTFPSSGTYRVEINGDFPRIYFNSGGDKDKILTIDQWGSIQWKSMNSAFYGAKNMQLTTTVAPDLSQVSDMSSMFRDTETFNQDLSSWDVSKVSSMNWMFYRAKTFNSPLDDWNPGIDLADGCSLTSMFRDTEVFDQDLSSWDVSKVTSMAYMFHGAKAFNSPLDNWEPGIGLTDGCDLYSMFHDTEVFDQDLSSWDVSKVSTMQNMFHGANAFNSSLISWRPGIGLTDGCSLHSMFRDTETFNQDLSSWDVSKVSTMRNMFYGAKAFNSPLVGWKPGIGLTDGCSLHSMFKLTKVFNQDLSSWNVSKVSSMNSMFHGAKAFNSPLDDWNPGVDLMEGCNLFVMFRDTEVFNQDLSSWDISSVTNMGYMFSNSALSVANYDATLIGWAAQSDIPQNLKLGANGLKYCQSQAARQSLIDDHGWTISGDMEECAAVITPSADNILYVNKSVSGGNSSGDSWANAIPELADALQWARQKWDTHSTNAGWDESTPLAIYVATGTYKPLYNASDGSYTTNGDRHNAFVMVPNTHIYGGFPTNGNPTLNERNWKSHPTILSGDVDNNDDTDFTNNAYHVLIAVGDLGNSKFSGFTISGGNANGNFNEPITVYGETEIIPAIGGGVLNVSNIEICETEITNNIGTICGGWCNLGNNPTLKYVIIHNNKSNTAGGWYNNDGNAKLTNVMITNNTGNAWYHANGSPVLTNVTILGNWKMGTSNAPIAPKIYNSILTGNNTQEVLSNEYTIKNSIVKDLIYDENSATQTINPLVIDETNFMPTTNSPAINAGNNFLYLNTGGNLENDLDLAGNPRISNGIIDLGAYEYQQPLPVSLLNFTAKTFGKQVLLTWVTTKELQNKGFIIYRSGDDGQFVQIAEKQGINNSKITNTYILYDYTPLNGNNYYRLVQVDENGEETLLDVKSVNFHFKNMAFHLYPNPTTDTVTLNWQPGAFTTLTLTNLYGQVLQNIELNPTESVKTISLAKYPPATYLLTLKGINHTESRKVVKQ